MRLNETRHDFPRKLPEHQIEVTRVTCRPRR